MKNKVFHRKDPEYFANNTSVNITGAATEIRETILVEKPIGTVRGVVTN